VVIVLQKFISVVAWRCHFGQPYCSSVLAVIWFVQGRFKTIIIITDSLQTFFFEWHPCSTIHPISICRSMDMMTIFRRAEKRFKNSGYSGSFFNDITQQQTCLPSNFWVACSSP